MSSSTQPDAVISSPASGPDGTIQLKIMSPSPGVPPNLSYRVQPTATVAHLKALIKDSLASRPLSDQQKLIYRGKILQGSSTIGESLIGNQEKQDVYTLHLVLVPQRVLTIAHPADAPPSTASADSQAVPTTTIATLRQRASAEAAQTTAAPPQWSASVSDEAPATMDTSTASPVPGLTLERLQEELRHQRELLDTMRRRNAATPRNDTSGVSSGVSLPQHDVHRPSSVPPTLPSDLHLGQRVHLHVPAPSPGLQDPTSPSRESPSDSIAANARSLPPATDPSGLPTPEQTIAQNIEYMEMLRREQTPISPPVFPATEETAARRRALQESLRELQQESVLFPTPVGVNVATSAPQPLNFTNQAIPENSLVYLLQDQFGRPNSLLVGPPGSALRQSPGFPTTAHYQMNSGAHMHHNIIAQPIPQMPQAPAVPELDQNNPLFPGQILPQDQTARQRELLNPNARIQQLNLPQDLAARQRELLARQNPNARIQQLNLPRVAERMRERAGHLWLALKLVVFVVLFTGNGGWKRRLYLGLIAVCIFIWQTGMFSGVSRQFADIINPPLQPPGTQQPQTNDGEMDPAQTARMLLERQQRGMREVVGRAFMIFMASLVPGWHDNHVDAIERRQREEQAAVAEAQAQAQQQATDAGLRDEPQPAEVGGAEAVEVEGNGIGGGLL